MTRQTGVEDFILAPVRDSLLNLALFGFCLQSQLADGPFALRTGVFDLVDPLLDARCAILMLTGVKAGRIASHNRIKADSASEVLFLLIELFHHFFIAMDRPTQIDSFLLLISFLY